MTERGVIEIVENTRAIQWWIDQQWEKGKSNDEIEAMLPYAVAFITGKLTLSDLLAVRA